MRVFLPTYDRMPTRNSRRNGVVSRLLSPVNEGIKFLTGASSNVFNAGKGVVRVVGNGSRRLLGRATNGLNSAGRRLLTGKRQSGGKRRSASRKTRKVKRSMKKSRKSRR